MGDPEIASCPQRCPTIGANGKVSCLYYCNLGLLLRQCAQHALYLLVPMVRVRPYTARRRL
jgi:hypothetical protein